MASTNSRLLDLPVELKILIVSAVHESKPRISSWSMPGPWITASSTVNLSALARTCKNLHEITTPILYHSPRPIHGHVFLLRTLLKRPDLASHVHALECGEHDRWRSEYKNEQKLSEFDGLESDLRATAQRLNLTTRSSGWFGRRPSTQNIMAEIGQVIFEFTLALVADNIEAVRYTNYGRSSTYPLGMSQPELPFPKLRLIFISTTDVFSLDMHAHLLLNSPELEHIWLRGCRSLHTRYDLPNLRSLRLASCHMTQAHLETLLSGCKQLEDFSCIQQDWVQSVPITQPEFNLREVVDLLRPFAGTLPHLVLGRHEETNRNDSRARLGPFAAFTHLETLLLHPDSFYTRDIRPETFVNSSDFPRFLPKGIKYLGLVNPGPGQTFEPRSALTEAIRDGEFPNLQKISLGPRPYTEMGIEIEIEKTEAVVNALSAGEVQCVESEFREDGSAWAHGSPTYNFNHGKRTFLLPSPNDW